MKTKTILELLKYKKISYALGVSQTIPICPMSWKVLSTRLCETECIHFIKNNKNLHYIVCGYRDE